MVVLPHVSGATTKREFSLGGKTRETGMRDPARVAFMASVDLQPLLDSSGPWPGFGSDRPLVIGVGGGSGSGKTTFARGIVEFVGSSVEVVQQDAYYRDQTHLTLEERTAINYDHPDALETELLVEHLDELRAGKPIDRPVYDFSTHTRASETVRVSPESVVVVEGILVLAEPELRDLFDLSIYVDADADLRLLRRLRRDLVERGRSVESVLTMYEATVRPMHLQFVEPSKRYADLIVQDGFNLGAVGTVTSMIRHVQAERAPAASRS